MLFFYFLAALSASTGWMMFWSLFGMFFSSRPSRYFFLPLFFAAIQEPKMGAICVIITWLVLFFSTEPKSMRAEVFSSQPHQPAKPGV